MDDGITPEANLCSEDACSDYRVELEDRIRELEEELSSWRRTAECITTERDDARRFGEGAAAKYNALINGARVIHCAFCDEEYPEGTPATQHEALTAHVKVCPAHPMREVERELDELRAQHSGRRSRTADAVERLRATFELRPDCNTIGDAVEDACAQFDRVKAAAMNRVEAQAVLEQCSNGHQACHRCPALACCDNTAKVPRGEA